MPTIYDCSAPEGSAAGIQAAREALERGELVVIPTGTVYGIAADAFNAAAVGRLRDAKGSGRQSPPAVLVADTVMMNALAVRVPAAVHQLTPRFWPGGLTLVLQAQPALEWDLGETDGTVAVRMPDDALALELLRATGPLAVSSANAAGLPAAATAAAAAEMLGDAVAVYLDGDATPGGDDDDDESEAAADAVAEHASTTAPAQTSTILDATGAAGRGKYRILRHGAVTVEQLRIALGDDSVIDPVAAPVESSAETIETVSEAPAAAPEGAPAEA